MPNSRTGCSFDAGTITFDSSSETNQAMPIDGFINGYEDYTGEGGQRFDMLCPYQSHR